MLKVRHCLTARLSILLPFLLVPSGAYVLAGQDPPGPVGDEVTLSFEGRTVFRRGAAVPVRVSGPGRAGDVQACLKVVYPSGERVDVLRERPLPQEGLHAEFATHGLLPGTYTAVLDVLQGGKTIHTARQTFSVLADADFVASQGRFVFHGRRTFRPHEPVVGSFECPGAQGLRIAITLSTASEPLAQRIELERPGHARRKEEQDLLERLRALPADSIAPLRTLFQGPISAEGTVGVEIGAGFLPPGRYVLEARLAEEKPAAQELIVIHEHLDWRRTLVTAVNCHVLTNIPSIHNLVDAGVNAVQVHARPKDMAEMDRVMAHDITVISGATMLPSVPAGAHPVQFDGQPGSRQFYSVCYNHPEVPPLITRQCDKTLRAVSDHPSILAYWTINEVHENDKVCYCPHCRAAFRGYLEDRYKTPEALAATWHEPVSSFEAVLPPFPPSVRQDRLPALPPIPGDKPATQATPEEKKEIPNVNGYAWYDWVQFRYGSVRRFLKRALDETRRVDPIRPVGNKGIVHYFFSHDHRSPWYELAPDSDLFWYSSYAGTRMDIADYAEIATSLKPVAWVSEYNHLGSPDAMRGAECFSGYMHGLTGIVWFCYQPYRETFGYFGLVEENWSRGERYQGLARAYKAARAIEPVLTQAPLVRGPVAVVWSDTTMVHAVGEGEDGALAAAFLGTVEALMRLKVSSTALADYQASPEALSGYRVVFLPGAACLAPSLAKVLATYVEAGGTLVAEAEAGWFDHGRQVAHGLDDLLGLEQMDRLPKDPLELPLAPLINALEATTHTAGTLPARIQPVRPLEGTEVLLSHPISRQPVLTRRLLGKGRVYYLAFPFGQACFKKDASAPGLVLMGALGRALGLYPNVEVLTDKDACDLDTDAVVRQLPEGGVKYVLAVNYGDAGERRFVVPGNAAQVRELFTHTRPATSQTTLRGQPATAFTTRLEKWRPYAFMLDNGQPIGWKTTEDDEAVLVAIKGEVGALIEARLTDERGFQPKPLRALIRPGEVLRFPRYGVYQGRLDITVGEMATLPLINDN